MNELYVYVYVMNGKERENKQAKGTEEKKK